MKFKTLHCELLIEESINKKMDISSNFMVLHSKNSFNSTKGENKLVHIYAKS